LKTLIVGAGEAGALLARDLMRNGGNLSVTAFVDDDKQKTGKRVSGLDVIGDTLHLAEIVKAEKFKVVLIAIPSALGEKIRAIYEQLAPLGVQVRLLPSLRELADGHVSVTRLRDIKLEDLLGRDPVKIDLDESSNYIKNKRVLITGAGGSIGSEIVRQVLRNKPSEIFVLGHGEQSIYLLLESLSELNLNIKVTPIIADVADSTAINNIFAKYKPELIFHAAAHKHVPLMEFSPREALRVNGIGTRTLARAAGKFKAERMVLISTDKAVNPSSVMGATKRVAEKVIEREQKNFPETLYMAVRFGNVLGSRGSVIPKFEKQIAAGGPVTVTAKGMKRYFMLIPEAVSLVIQAGAMGCGGDLFVLDMGEQVVITEMAELLIRLYGYEPYKDIAITFTGIRPGEKLEEELFYDPNKVHPTKHHKIFSSSFKSALDDDNLNFNELLEQAVSEPDNALNLLHKLVPEFKKIN
ncbi:MAG: polysaccharide biosynthesis protein, partial [Synergistaceae bacterium]|nr:polysaccharide biosynthesis protein [Synergistaceae bacterium]